MTSEDYWESDNLVARLNLPNMQWSPAQKVRVYAQAIKGLLSLEPDPEKQLKYIDFIDIYSALDDNEMQEYATEYPQENKAMATLSERLREEGLKQGLEQGMKQGMQQGMQQGRLEGEATLLKRQISRRFGALDDATEKRLEMATIEELERWAENVLDARELEDVFTQH
jgi:flagellar biosynthesis/type III secretory pathway protein FliH